MKLDYTILWVEDHFDKVKHFERDLKNRLEQNGFNLVVDKRNGLSQDELRILEAQLDKYNPYDFVIFDYDLGSQDVFGSDLAREIRKSIYTGIIFYSGKSPEELRDIVVKKGLDGVYVVDRTRFTDDVWRIIRDHIKSICNINSMRGVVLDEMSKIDLLIRDLLSKSYSAASGETQESHKNKLIRDFESKRDRFNDKAGNVTVENFCDLIQKPQEVEFELVKNRLSKFFKQEEIIKTDLIGKLQNLRNRFAHKKSIFSEELGTISLIGEEEIFDFTKFTEIRKELMTLREAIERILKES